MCAKYHGNFLTVYDKGFLLEVRFEDPFSATQRKAHIVTVLFAFTGKLASCCHSFHFHLFLTIFTSVRFFSASVKDKQGPVGAIMGGDERNNSLEYSDNHRSYSLFDDAS